MLGTQHRMIGLSVKPPQFFLSLDPLVVTRNGSHPLDKDVSRQPGEEVDKGENTGNPSGRNYSLFSRVFLLCVRGTKSKGLLGPLCQAAQPIYHRPIELIEDRPSDHD